MAYNRSANPDELPRFAEPERKGPAPSSRHEQPPPALRQDPAPRPSHERDPRRPSHERDPRRLSHERDPRRLSPTHQNSGYGHMSPPAAKPGPRPTPHTRPPAVSRPPPTPSPDPGSDPTLLPLFRAVDKNGTGQLSEKELSAALVNGDWTSFDDQTVRMMIRMFDSDHSGTIGFQEFCGLWSFLASWRTLFDRFDTDHSGNISFDEFTNALVAFRYRLSPGFTSLLFRSYDKRGEGVMSFDLFVQSCISLKRMTDVFKQYDEDRDGYITLSFEDFLSEIIKQLQ